MSWEVQPVCLACWNTRNPFRRIDNIATLVLAVPEFCCHCGGPAVNGLYQRVDTELVDHPQPSV